MNSHKAGFGRPERFLLLLARGKDDCRGKAVRMSDSMEIRFSSLDELSAWLKNAEPSSAIHARHKSPENLEDA